MRWTTSSRATRKHAQASSSTYTASGSGAGVADFLAAKTDFGGSDSPLSGDEYAAAKQRCGGADAWNLPVVFGPIGITFNVKTTDVLTLDAPTLAKIFSGAITRWDDPAITALNGNMPAEDIHVIYRSDASGTSDNFQQYLQAASGGAWTKGAGKTFNGGVGTSAQGNEGTSEAVKNTEGAISYNEWSYAMKQHLDVAGIKTAGGVVHIGNDWVGKTISDVTIKGQGQRPRARPLEGLRHHDARRLPDPAGQLRNRLLQIPRCRGR